jgi:thioredoxin 1
MALEVTKETYHAEVESSPGLVLVDFWGPACVPCLALMPFVDELAEKHEQEIKVVKVDSSKNRRLCIDLKVMGLPTFLIYKNGQEMDRLSRKDINEEELSRFVALHLVKS